MSNGLGALLGALGGVVLALLAVRGLAAGAGNGPIQRLMYGGMVGGGVPGVLLRLLFSALVVALVAGTGVWLVTQLRQRRWCDSRRTPLGRSC